MDFKIIGISVKFLLNRQYISALRFNYDGSFEKGFFINEKLEIAIQKFSDFLIESSKENKNFLILINGLMSNEQIEVIKNSFKSKNYCCYRVNSSSIVRLFRTGNRGEVINKLITPGTGLFIDSQLHLITSEPSQGTQVGITIQKLFSNFKNEDKFLEEIFHFTRYNPAFFRNSCKLPFPIHFSSNALKKGITFRLETFSFNIPFYL